MKARFALQRFITAHLACFVVVMVVERKLSVTGPKPKTLMTINGFNVTISSLFRKLPSASNGHDL